MKTANKAKALAVGWLLYSATYAAGAEAQENALAEPANPLSPLAQDIENYNVATPEHNLYLLAGKESDLNPAERLAELSTKEFAGTSPFFGLRSLLRHNRLNLAHRVGKCVDEFRVNDEETWRLGVTFEANAATGKWQVKHISQTKDGKTAPLPMQANDPLYQQGLSASTGCVFSEFPAVWQTLKGGDSSWWKSSDTIEKLTPLDGQRAVFENLVFYRQDPASPRHKIQTAVASIQLVNARPDPSKKQFQNGWLVAGFEFMDDSQEYELDKADGIVPPTPIKVFRNGLSQSGATGEAIAAHPPKAEDTRPNQHIKPQPSKAKPR